VEYQSPAVESRIPVSEPLNTLVPSQTLSPKWTTEDAPEAPVATYESPAIEEQVAVSEPLNVIRPSDTTR
jgi:hypothetical protein